MKRRVASLLISGAAIIIDEWSRAQKEIDFGFLKGRLTSDEVLVDLPGPTDKEEKRKFVAGVVDLLEYTAMAAPLSRVLGFLCEQARHRVLALSVEKAVASSTVERIIYGTWLADVDGSRGRQPLRDAIYSLPKATFFRVALAGHYLARVYWNHWQKGDRLMLLDAAEETLKPISMGVNKSELKRLIEKRDKQSDDA